MNVQTRCPKCDSTAIKSREAIYKSSTSKSSGRSFFSGLSFGLTGKARPRVFFGGSASSGTRQTILAQEAAPVPYTPGIVLLIISLFMFGGLPVVAFFLFLFSCLLLTAAMKDAEKYDTQWICTKCGNLFSLTAAKSKSLHKVMEDKTEKLMQLSEEINQDLTKRAKLNKANKMLRIIDELIALRDELHETARDRAGNNIFPKEFASDSFANLENKVNFIIKIADLIEVLGKADDKLISGDKAGEIRFLLEASRLIDAKKITDDELASVELQSVITDKYITIAGIQERLSDAGYKPENEIEKRLNYDEDKKNVPPSVTVEPVVEQPTSLEIIYYPSDEDSFKQEFLKKKVAYLLLYKIDGTKEIKEWKAVKFQPHSSVNGNLRSGHLRGWKKKGIFKVEISTDRKDLSNSRL